jgi:hypothetical protein
MKSSVVTSPSTNDSPRTFPMRAASANAAVTSSTSMPAARIMLGGLPAAVLHTSAWMMRNTFSSERVASSRANAATTNETIRSPVERSPMLPNAFAASPPMPA